jgi:hypothetical protein
MRREAANVKQLALASALWHWALMKKSQTKSKEERLAEALRANLRRRKVAAKTSEEAKPSTDKNV